MALITEKQKISRSVHFVLGTQRHFVHLFPCSTFPRLLKAPWARLETASSPTPSTERLQSHLGTGFKTADCTLDPPHKMCYRLSIVFVCVECGLDEQVSSTDHLCSGDVKCKQRTKRPLAEKKKTLKEVCHDCRVAQLQPISGPSSRFSKMTDSTRTYMADSTRTIGPSGMTTSGMFYHGESSLGDSARYDSRLDDSLRFPSYQLQLPLHPLPI
jgi:hypothetical protein